MKRLGLLRLVRVWMSLLAVVMLLPAPAQANPFLRAAPRLTSSTGFSVAPPAVLEISADAFGMPLHKDEWTAAYPKPAVRLERGERIAVSFEVEEYGDYLLSMDVLAGADLIGAPEGELRIDDELPAADVPRVVFPVYYLSLIHI